MLKRLMAVLFALLLLCPMALAEIPCQCGQVPCACFIQQGDEGPAVEFIQNTLIAQGYLAKRDDATVFDQAAVQAVMAFQTAHALPPTGMMDDATLTLLLWGMLPEELDVAQPMSTPNAVWIPTDGGRRHHRKHTCSRMETPRLVSHRNAIMMDMTRCGRCKPTGLDTIIP